MSIGVNIITSHFWLLLTYFVSENQTYDDGADLDKLTDDTNDIRSVTILKTQVKIYFRPLFLISRNTNNEQDIFG